MATAKSTYMGGLRTSCTHLQSGTSILTDAPTDNHGKGEAFSPTDLVATALGTCIMTTMAIFAQRDGIELEGSVLEMTKMMSQEPPRKIAEIVVKLELKSNRMLTKEEKSKYEHIAHTCPVARSLHPDLVQTVEFCWV